MNLLFELIKVRTGYCDKLTEVPSSEQWNQLYYMAVKQSIDSYLIDALERIPSEQLVHLSRATKSQWIARTLVIEEKNKHLNDQCKLTLDFFRENGFPGVILKGQGCASLYPEPLHRTCGDIDVWIEASRNQVYKFALQTSGKVEGANYHHIHYPLFEDTEVELHFWPSYLTNPICNRRLHKFAYKYAPDGTSDFPSMEFNRVYVLLHCFRHLCGHGVGLRQVMDYYYVLAQGFTDEEKRESMNWIKTLGMKKFAGAMMWLLSEVFGLEEKYFLCDPDEREGRFFLSEIMISGNMGFYDNRVAPDAYSSAPRRFVSNLKRNFHLATHYPSESLCAPFFSICLYIYRLFKGILYFG